jgi:hypothetical protein
LTRFEPSPELPEWVHEPDWLHRRKISREAVPLNGWRPDVPEELPVGAVAEPSTISLSASDLVLAVLPLAVGLLLLFLGVGAGQLTFQT